MVPSIDPLKYHGIHQAPHKQYAHATRCVRRSVRRGFGPLFGRIEWYAIVEEFKRQRGRFNDRVDFDFMGC
jgi:hypothetical protein